MSAKTEPGTTGELLHFLGSCGKHVSGEGAYPVGSAIGPWRILAFIGRGGNGEVYRVENVNDGSVAALKIQPPSSRFQREISFLRENQISCLPRFFGAGAVGEKAYYAMELLDEIELPEKEHDIAAFMLCVCRAVRNLHLHGIVHRDIKPKNLMRRPGSGEIVLIDLGLGKSVSYDSSEAVLDATIEKGKVVGGGTLKYSAPEQFFGGKISPAADIHALGVLANDCFNGNPPRAWDRIISRATSSVPERRYQSVEDFVRAVRRRNIPKYITWCITVLSAIAIVTTLIPLILPKQLPQKIKLDAGLPLVEKEPIVLKSGQVLEFVGPGGVNALVEGPPDSLVRLTDCFLVNCVKEVRPENCPRYHITGKGSGINFISIDKDHHEEYIIRGKDGIIEFSGGYDELFGPNKSSLKGITYYHTPRH